MFTGGDDGKFEPILAELMNELHGSGVRLHAPRYGSTQVLSACVTPPTSKKQWRLLHGILSGKREIVDK